MDMMLPYTVSFEKNAKSKAFTKVVFNSRLPVRASLPGRHCYPTDTRGSNLSAVYAKIQHLIAPHGQPPRLVGPRQNHR